MSDRAALKTRFLSKAGWDTAHRTLIAGDASNRKYERLTQDGHSRVLMDAPPDKGEDIRPFVTITKVLRAANLSAPDIFAQDAKNGFLLIEDLGDDLFARVIDAQPELEARLYCAATDVLLHLHQCPPPELPRYNARVMTDAACLAYDWYLRGAVGSVNTTARAAFADAAIDMLTPLDACPAVLIQRDYHAENLLWLPERAGVQRVGLLDYQDAMLGHPAYDLVSVLQDARRDVPANLQTEMIDRYIAGAKTDASDFKGAFVLLGLQRNLRILGVFARLSLAYGKPHYVDLIPRVWNHIDKNLADPVAADIAPLIRSHLPAPTPDILNSLKSQCKTIPLP